MQYSISNLNAFVILVTIGFSLYSYENQRKQNEELLDKNNSPLQLVSQIKGYFYINPILSVSFAITIFSFVGIPPLLGFFAKQMVLSAALDNGYVFISFVAILTSVIGAVYYLSLIKEIFFYPKENEAGEAEDINGSLFTIKSKKTLIESMIFNSKNLVMSSPMAITISIVSLIILLFIFINKE
jgi:NADH-ubiquinone oxidoreductase chain 2